MPAAGWTVTKLIAQVNGRTENRASNRRNFDMQMEFFLGLDEFCQEKHYWWRRKVASLQTVIGQQTYDLSTTAEPNPIDAGDCEEIEEMYAINAAPVFRTQMVHPRFNARQQLAAIYGVQIPESSLLPPAGYFIQPGGFQELVFSQPPQEVTTVGFTYWAVPMVGPATYGVTDVVPLVPPFLHWGLIYMLERRVYEYLYGQTDPRFVTSNARYQQFVQQAAKSKQFSSQEAIHSRMASASVTSSGGRGSRGSYYGRE